MSFPITCVADYLADWHRRRRRDRLDTAAARPLPAPVRCRQGKRPGAVSAYLGVHPYKTPGRWRASFHHKARQYTCGVFPTEIEAARAYDAKVREVIGPGALTNFPEEAG